MSFYFLVRHKLLFLRSVSSFLTASTNYVVHLRFFDHCCFPGIDHTEKTIGDYGIGDRSDRLWFTGWFQYKGVDRNDV